MTYSEIVELVDYVFDELEKVTSIDSLKKIESDKRLDGTRLCRFTPPLMNVGEGVPAVNLDLYTTRCFSIWKEEDKKKWLSFKVTKNTYEEFGKQNSKFVEWLKTLKIKKTEAYFIIDRILFAVGQAIEEQGKF